MAVASIKDLWELAVTLMGGNAAAEIIDTNTDMSSPSTPIELTLDQVYTQVRVSTLESANWRFAAKHTDLIPGPSAQYNGDALRINPNDRWSHIYRVPSDCLQFLGFAADEPDLEHVVTHRIRRLPVKYETATSTSESIGVFFFTTGIPFSGLIYRGTPHALVVDESNVTHRLTDTQDIYYGAGDNFFVWKNAKTGYADTVLGGAWDYNSVETSSQIALLTLSSDPAMNFSTGTWPASITVEVGVVAANNSDWTDHILCNREDAVGAYIADVTDPGDWPSQFQMYVAAQLARHLAIVHSKSSKQIDLANRLVQESKQEALEDLAADHGTVLTNRAMSTTEKARL